MPIQTTGRVLCLHAAAKRLGIPERTLRYRASRGRVPGAFKQGKLWKFEAAALPVGMSTTWGSRGASAGGAAMCVA